MAAELPKTAAETSNYLSTSRYADVMAFVGAIQRADADIRVETFATTNEGRALPLVIVGPYTPRSAHASGKPVVLIMANIHAGEDADDRHDDHQFDQCEAALAAFGSRHGGSGS